MEYSEPMSYSSFPIIFIVHINKKNFGKNRSLESNQTKEMKMADLFTRDNEKCNISHVPLASA